METLSNAALYVSRIEFPSLNSTIPEGWCRYFVCRCSGHHPSGRCYSSPCISLCLFVNRRYALAMEAEAQANLLSDAELIERFEETLRSNIKSFSNGNLRAAISYAVFGGGKRIRPILCMRACQAVGGEIDKAVYSAGSIELIHTFSLVHDDLPAMDDDDLRRGRPTLHKHTNEAMAILAGDSMTALAFYFLGCGYEDHLLSAKLIREMAGATQAMIEGQVHDTMGDLPERMTDIERLRYIHHHKTTALISAAVRMGAITGGANEDQFNALAEYATPLGLMFQAVDDLLDVTQSTEKMGKATGKDAEQGKLTYPGLLGIDGTRAEIEKLRRQAIDALSGFDAKADPLREMAERLAKRQR